MEVHACFESFPRLSATVLCVSFDFGTLFCSPPRLNQVRSCIISIPIHPSMHQSSQASAAAASVRPHCIAPRTRNTRPLIAPLTPPPASAPPMRHRSRLRMPLPPPQPQPHRHYRRRTRRCWRERAVRPSRAAPRAARRDDDEESGRKKMYHRIA
jgi:hypothetical protein